MARDAFLLEQMGRDNRWSIVCGCDTSAEAQMWMAHYQRSFRQIAFRVTENATRRLICMHDPIVDRA